MLLLQNIPRLQQSIWCCCPQNSGQKAWMLSEVLFKTSLAHIWVTEHRWYHLVPLFLTWKQYFVGCLKDQYWSHFFSLFIEMTFRNCLKLLDFHLSTDYENFLSSMRTSTYLKVKLTVNLEKYIFGYLQTPVSFQIQKVKFCYFSSSTKSNSLKGYAIYK